MKTESGNEEREFLHDVSGPLGTVIFLVDSLLENMQSRADANPTELMQLTDVFRELQKVKQILHDRRAVLIKKGVSGART